MLVGDFKWWIFTARISYGFYLDSCYSKLLMSAQWIDFLQFLHCGLTNICAES